MTSTKVEKNQSLQSCACVLFHLRCVFFVFVTVLLDIIWRKWWRNAQFPPRFSKQIQLLAWNQQFNNENHMLCPCVHIAVSHLQYLGEKYVVIFHKRPFPFKSLALNETLGCLVSYSTCLRHVLDFLLRNQCVFLFLFLKPIDAH